MKKTHLLLTLATAALTSAAIGQFNIVDDFESYSPGSVSGNIGSFDVIDATSTIGSGQAAQITSQISKSYSASGSVITASFDFYNPSDVLESESVRFSLNHGDKINMVSSSAQIIRISMSGGGFFAFEYSDGSTVVDSTYPLDTLVTAHLVFNGSTDPVSYAGKTLDAKSIDLWKEVDGALSFVGSGLIQSGKDLPLTNFGFGTPSAYTSGDLMIDNIRYADGAAVVPEPSTYAVIFGLLSMVGILIHRRRKQ